MNSSFRRLLVAVVSVALVMPCAIPSIASAQVEAPAAPAARGPQDIMADVQAATQELRAALPNPAALRDPAARAAAAPAAIPAVKKMLGLFDELAAANPMAAQQIGPAKGQFTLLLAALGDTDTLAALKTKADGGDAVAKGNLLAADYITSTDDAARTATVTQLADSIKANPASAELAMLGLMTTGIGSAPAADEKMITDAVAQGSTPLAKQFAAQAEKEMSQKALIDKPFVLSGKLHTGETFSTEQWKGKVVLVDFWATWCGPCVEELPRMKKIFQQYKDQGLMIVGVSCDEKLEDLNKFLAENPEMTWPHFFDASSPGWHSMATKFGVDGIPQMFLIDKKGVLRTVDARANMEEMIPKLLAE
jgi:thiol-disulfide isomerase/thioredoxin